MDLNQLLFHHQIALIREDLRKPSASSGSRFDLAAYYERRIHRLRREMGAAQYPSWLA